MSEWTGLISATTALLAVLVAPISGYYIARRQILATSVAANRQAWINDLRERLAEFATVLFELAGRGEQEDIERFRASIGRFEFLRTKVKLMLNPKEPDHQELAAMLDRAFEFAAMKRKTELLNEKQAIIALTQKILKCEWERVKLGT